MVDKDISVVIPVYISKPEHLSMTSKCIDAAKKTALDFELIISETETDYFRDHADIHVFEKNRTRPSRSVDRGFKMASGKYVVFLGNDVMVCEKWLEYLLDCFVNKSDCGIASLGNNEHNDVVRDEIIESIYFSVCMMKKEDAWFDPSYKQVFDDTDLIFRLHTQGKKFYKNLNGFVNHNPHSTLGEMGGDVNDYEISRKYFINKYKNYCNDSLYKELSGIL